MKILHFIPHLDYSGISKQLTLLTLGLPRARFDVQVCVLGKDSQAAAFLRQQGLMVHVLGRTTSMDLVSLWKIRHLVQTIQPDVLHVWGRTALRCLLAAGKISGALVASYPFTPFRAGNRLNFWDRWLLDRADRVVVRGQAEAERCLGSGLSRERIDVIPPAVGHIPWTDNSKLPPLPATSRLLLCAGRLEPHRGFRDAIWAFEFMSLLFADVDLVLAGAGPDRTRLERFGVRNRIGRRVHFLGERSNVPELLSQAEMVLVPSLADCGSQTALESLAAAKPVLASRWPGLCEVVRDGENGFLFPHGNQKELGNRMRRLLLDPDLGRRLGEAGRRRAMAFSADHLVNRFLELYSELAPGASPRRTWFYRLSVPAWATRTKPAERGPVKPSGQVDKVTG